MCIDIAGLYLHLFSAIGYPRIMDLHLIISTISYPRFMDLHLLVPSAIPGLWTYIY